MPPTIAQADDKTTVPIEELMDALSDEAKAEELIARYGLTREDLVEQAEAAARSLSAEISTLNVV